MNSRQELFIQPNLADPDRFYAALLDAHAGRTEQSSAEFNARLVLLLANHIGDLDVLDDALAAARGED